MSYDQHFKKLKALNKGKAKRVVQRAAAAAMPVKKLAAPNSRSAPFLALASIVMVGLGAWVWTIGEDGVNRLLNKIEFHVFGMAVASEEKPAEHAEKKEKPAEHDKEKKSETHVASKTFTEEEISLFQKLESRKKELDSKQEELKSLETELQKQREEFEKKMAVLEQMRNQISTKLEGQVAVDEQKLMSLVSLYQNMKPGQAAKVIEGLNEDLAVDILMKMKNKSAAEILNFMNTDKAKKLSEQFAGYRALANKNN